MCLESYSESTAVGTPRRCRRRSVAVCGLHVERGAASWMYGVVAVCGVAVSEGIRGVRLVPRVGTVIAVERSRSGPESRRRRIFLLS